MKYKEFADWCNQRACDGMWGMNTASACIGVIDYIQSKPFWRRERAWQEFNRDFNIDKIFVNPINEKISALTGKQVSA